MREVCVHVTKVGEVHIVHWTTVLNPARDMEGQFKLKTFLIVKIAHQKIYANHTHFWSNKDCEMQIYNISFRSLLAQRNHNCVKILRVVM